MGNRGDSTIVNGTARIDDTTDIIRAFPAVLTAPGETATFSFTLNIATANSSEAYEVAFAPSSAPFGFGNTNYGSGFVLDFDYATGAQGMSAIEVLEGRGVFSGDNTGSNIVLAGSMSGGLTHTISVTLTRGVTNKTYSLFLDNALLRNGHVCNERRPRHQFG